MRPLKIYLRRRHALLVGDGASSHKIDYVRKLYGIENLEGHQDRITGSRVMAILLNGLILPIGEVATGRVCACSLRSRLVFEYQENCLHVCFSSSFFVVKTL